MAFLNRLSDIAKNIGDKAGMQIETTKLNSKINSERGAIDGVNKKIGEYYYQQYKTGASLPNDVVLLCEEIDAHNAAIDEARAEIERLKRESEAAAAASAAAAAAPVQYAAPPPAAPEGAVVCQACGKPNGPGTKFCQECGAKIEIPEKQLCASCGAEIKPGVRFCSECGTKIE